MAGIHLACQAPNLVGVNITVIPRRKPGVLFESHETFQDFTDSIFRSMQPGYQSVVEVSIAYWPHFFPLSSSFYIALPASSGVQIYSRTRHYLR